MTGDGAVRSAWNVSLLEDIIAPCYVRFIVTAAASLGPTTQYFSLWPCQRAPSRAATSGIPPASAGLPRSSAAVGVLQEPWLLVKNRFFSSLGDKAVLWTRAGERWIAPRDAVVCIEEDIAVVDGESVFVQN